MRNVGADLGTPGRLMLAAPGDRSEWVACALAFALTGVVWTVNGALSRNGEDLQASVR